MDFFGLQKPGASAMTARRKILIVGLAGAAVLAVAAGSLAWKNLRPTKALAGQAPAGTATRPIELISAELYVTVPRDLVDMVRFTGTTQPIE